MDYAMPNERPVATRRILETTRVAVLMLSMHAEETLVRQALDAGALLRAENALDPIWRRP
jgi:DNA-binding NarL/FixJ family response regulator